MEFQAEGNLGRTTRMPTTCRLGRQNTVTTLHTSDYSRGFSTKWFVPSFARRNYSIRHRMVCFSTQKEIHPFSVRGGPLCAARKKTLSYAVRSTMRKLTVVNITFSKQTCWDVPMWSHGHGLSHYRRNEPPH